MKRFSAPTVGNNDNKEIEMLEFTRPSTHINDLLLTPIVNVFTPRLNQALAVWIAEEKERNAKFLQSIEEIRLNLAPPRPPENETYHFQLEPQMKLPKNFCGAFVVVEIQEVRRQEYSYDPEFFKKPAPTAEENNRKYNPNPNNEPTKAWVLHGFNFHLEKQGNAAPAIDKNHDENDHYIGLKSLGY